MLKSEETATTKRLDDWKVKNLKQQTDCKQKREK